MNRTEDVTIELSSNGMIVHDPISCEGQAEHYVISDADLYIRPVPLSRLWLMWFCSLHLLAALIYLSVLLFGK